ncbi:MAG: DUF3473 domain-containing protein [Desulfobacterales bacterium]|nr:DUF3473 domain-containing protein [Desulfobacterales bacterium]
MHASESKADLTGADQSLRQRRIEFHHFHPESDEQKKSNQSSKSCLTKNSPKATFFILGWIAERLPGLVREIHARGHEIASHGYYHKLCTEQSPDALKKDLCDSKKLLEDTTGAPVYGYRGPSFAINEDILKVIEDCGYLYDSSYNSFALHGRYGHIDLSQNGTKGIAFEISNALNGSNERSDRTNLASSAISMNNMFPSSQLRNFSSSLSSPRFYELPISNLKLGNNMLPWGGGTYFRLLPSPLFEMGVKSILKKHGAYLFYMHPWEVDPAQPKVNQAPRFFKFRHYVNLDKAASKLSSFVEAFKQCSFVTCHQYLYMLGEN